MLQFVLRANPAEIAANLVLLPPLLSLYSPFAISELSATDSFLELKLQRVDAAHEEKENKFI